MSLKHIIRLLLLLSFSLSISIVIGQDVTTLRVVLRTGELTPESIAQFEAANPDIQIEFVDYATFSYEAALLLDEVPDVMRVQAADMTQLVRDGLLLDITPYMNVDSVIQQSDLANATRYYKFDDRYYGLPKDWSPDFSLYVYNPAFEAAGIPIPSTTLPLTYAELAEIAKQLVLKEGNATIQYGFSTPQLERTITSILTQRGISLFNRDFTEMHLIDNPEALEVIRYFYDMSLNGSMYPFPGDETEWLDIQNGRIAIFQYGYWYGGFVTSELPVYDNLTMLPAPTWDRDLPRLNTTIGPIGISILTSTQHPAEAYRFMEWYIAGEEGIRRVKTGWGAPTLLSMFSLLPQATAFDRQRFSVLQTELAYSNWTLPQYPYEGIRTVFNESWNRNIQQAQMGEIDFDIFASNIQEAVNLNMLSEQ